ncbi:uncharacterized protein [Halyomorpha halys]|uniref:uncharacterized protein n=1 Tax=Halyomorpha halys TaxID=286706 RepID=UPI0006D4D7EB|nr:uncharacterized protein LOC106690381 [Halyomorpha halys]
MWPSSQRPASFRLGCGVTIVLVAALIAKEVEARLPPKLLKVASGTRKALYARGYGYSVIPIPQKILLQANFARREVHGKRPPVRSKRPPRRNKRPPPEYASRYKDYRPGRKRRPLIYAGPPEYHEQELDEELDYEDQSNKDYDDFVSKHAELYADGYSTRKKPKRPRDEVAAYTENSEPVYVRKPPSRWRTSTKLYSAAIGARRPLRQKDKFEYEVDEGDNNFYYKQKDRRKNRYEGKYRGERYREPEEDDEEAEEEDNQHRYQLPKKNPVRNWDPDNVYHDRYYDLKQEKIRRAVQPPRSYSNQYIPGNNRWRTESENEDDRPRWYANKNESPKRNPPFDTNKWTSPPDQHPWSDPGQHYTWSIQNQNFQGSQRWKEPGTVNDGRWSDGKENVEVKDTDIITSQNADKWVTERTTESPKEIQDWMKEHSVGYEIELEGGQKKKRLEGDPDVVYGQAGNSKPRIPDIRYGQGLEVAGRNGWGQNYQS